MYTTLNPWTQFNGHRVSQNRVDNWNKVLCHAMSTTAEGAGRRGSFREGQGTGDIPTCVLPQSGT